MKNEILSLPIIKGDNVFIAPTSTSIGNICLGNNSSVWFGAVLRGDSDKISIGNNTNIQDNVTIHVDPGYPVSIGNGCTIGHNAIVHGAIIGNNVLVGMGAIIMNGVEIGNNSIIGAGAMITGGTIIPPRSLVLGSPAKVTKQIGDATVLKIEENWKVYVKKAAEYLQFYKSNKT